MVNYRLLSTLSKGKKTRNILYIVALKTHSAATQKLGNNSSHLYGGCAGKLPHLDE